MAAKEEKENGKQEKKKFGAMKIIIAAIGALIVGGLIMGVFIYSFGIPGLAPKDKENKKVNMENLDLGERVVNLSDSGGSRYLRVRMVLEFKKDEKLATELKEKNAAIMEGIIHVFRSKNVDQIRPLDKEEVVKTEILESINKSLENGKIERIYFTDFLIQ
ncbi:MAG: flagellar basal body-associated FliL family protein [Actinobacteria bacterium]|nr:flagellar basal body-associated FliL family protein [Actinomycetota bacterium]